MQNFNQQADLEIQVLKEYYNKLSTFQKNYFFPSNLKHALEAYTSYEENGPAVYQALLNTSWFLRNWPFFSFLTQFITSTKNHVARAFSIASELGTLNTFKPTQVNNFRSQIDQLTQYKNNLSWFGKWFFPNELSEALDNFQTNNDLSSLVEVLQKHTSNWFFPVLNLLGQTAFMQICKTFEKELNDLPLEKKSALRIIAKSDCSSESFTRIKTSIQNKGCLEKEQIEEFLDWYMPYFDLPESGMQELFLHRGKFNENLVINLLRNIDPRGNCTKSQQQILAIESVIRLPNELLNDDQIMTLIINHTAPAQTALTLRSFDSHALLFNESNKNSCLKFLKESHIFQSLCMYRILDKLARLQPGMEELVITILDNPHELLTSLICGLWRLISEQQRPQVLQEFLAICNGSNVKESDIIEYFISKKEIFYSLTVCFYGEYDQHTASKVDKLVANSNTEEKLLLNLLPHLMRRNTEAANKTIDELLERAGIKNKLGEHSDLARKILNAAECNPYVREKILNLRQASLSENTLWHQNGLATRKRLDTDITRGMAFRG